MKNVARRTHTEFCNTSREQDRIVIYFGGHAIEKDGKAYSPRSKRRSKAKASNRR